MANGKFRNLPQPIIIFQPQPFALRRLYISLNLTGRRTFCKYNALQHTVDMGDDQESAPTRIYI